MGVPLSTRSLRLVALAVALSSLVLQACSTAESDAEDVDAAEPAPAADAEDDGDPGSPGDPMIITVADGTSPEGGDPARAGVVAALNISRHLYDMLVERNNEGDIVPRLATEWEQLDDLTMEFILTPDAVFHDGEPVTAEDVVYTIERILDEEKAFNQLSWLVPINGATAVGDHTVQVTTPEPYPLLLSKLASIPIVPKHYVEEVGDEEFNRTPLGSGPYEFVEWVPDSHFVLERFDNYWGDAPANDGLVFRNIPEASARVAGLISGDVDIIVNVSPGLVPEIESNPETELAPVPSVRTMFVGMNALEPPLDDVRVRKAINHALDRDQLFEHVAQGYGGRHNGVFGSPFVFGYDPAIEEHGYEYDPDRARELLAEAGYPDGLELSFEAPQGRYFQDADLASAIAGQLEEVGIRTDLRLMDWGSFVPRMQAFELEQLFFLGYGNTLMDADFFYGELFTEDGGTAYYHAGPEFEERFAASRKMLDPDERLELLHELHVELVDEHVPFGFLWEQADLYGKRAELQGWEPRPDELHDLRQAVRSGS